MGTVDRIVAVAAAAALMLVAGCDDGQSGLPTDPPKTPALEAAQESAPPESAPTPAPTSSTVVEAPTVAPVTVGAVPGNPAASAALQAWADDLVRSNADTLVSKCWTIAPTLVRSMYANPTEIVTIISRPGTDGQYAVSWTDGTTRVSVKRNEIAAGYACPHIYPEGTVNYYTDDDAEYAVTRLLSRVTGAPVNVADREADYRLICPGNSPWDPRGTGTGGQPPFKLDPTALNDVDDFDAAAFNATSLANGYVSVRTRVTVENAPVTRDVLLAVGPDGYCIGEVED